LIGLAVFAVLIALGLPSITEFLQNSQIRGAADSTLSGIQLARAEALRRNTSVRFQLMSSLDGSCVRSATGTNWVVSLDDAAGSCDSAPDETVAPRIIQIRSGDDGSSNAVITASGGAGDTNLLVFNGLGRLLVTNADAFTTVDVTNPTGGTCQASGGTMRCLRLTVSPNGDVRMCDPKITVATDSRKC
jgi:type IV fimbrial biogenesis protein FimT